MSKLKVLIVSVAIISTCILLYVLNTIVIIDESYRLTTQHVRIRELPSELRADVKVLPLGKQNALVFGYMELSGEKYMFHILSTHNANNLDERIYELTCDGNQTATKQIDNLIFIKLKGSVVEELELIETFTHYKSQKTESENGIYSLNI